MNKSQIEEERKKLSNLDLNDNCDDSCSDSETETETDEDDDLEDDEEDEDEDQIEVKSLFGVEKTFKNVKDLFKYEAETNSFNITDVLKRYNMSMIDYIKMINFIRKEKPDVKIFHKVYENESEIPWNKDEFMKTYLDDDAVLQFDVDEDLDLLDLKPEINNNQNDKKNENDQIRFYKSKLEESESKVEELVDIVGKLRKLASGLLEKSSTQSAEGTSKDVTSKNSEDVKINEDNDDPIYVNSYSNYNIHLEMLQDKVRTEGYMNAILNNKNYFKDKVVLDVGCGSGILSLFAAKAGAKLVIAVDMSNIIDQAIQIAKENGYQDKIVFLKGRMEQVKLPVEYVDIIISEWMGYFLLYESMLDAVLYARDRYLGPDGIILPNFFEMHLFGVSDDETHDKKIKFWSDVYGFKMNVMKKLVAKDAQILVLEKEHVVTDLFKFKEIDCLKCQVVDTAIFESEFKLNVNKDCELTGIGSSFETFFNHSDLEQKSEFSTSPFFEETHWQQVLFQFEEKISVKKDSVLNGKIKCYRNPDYLRSYIIELDVLSHSYKFKIE